MRSRAQVKGHPIHPMLVAFPIAFLSGSQFDARSGAVKAGPAESPIATYPVEQAGDEVRLRLPSA
jgi:hypothetical protein